MNSLIVKVNGTEYIFECHSFAKMAEIIAAHHALWETMSPKPSIDDIRWA